MPAGAVVSIRSDPEEPLSRCYRFVPSGPLCISMYMQVLVSIALLAASVTGVFIWAGDCDRRSAWQSVMTTVLGYWLRQAAVRTAPG